jgi:hypothetical protein
MSSFLHTPNHFNSIENSLISLKQKKYIFNRISKLDISECIDVHRKLSVICVFNQYKEKFDVEKNIKNLLDNKTACILLNPIELYKAIDSMEYQIEIQHLGREITDDETRAINLLKDIKINLADFIIDKLPEYDKAKWLI